MQFDASNYLTLRKAADRLGVTPETLSRWIRAGRVPAMRTPAGQYRVHAEDLWLAFEPAKRRCQEKPELGERRGREETT